MLLLVASASALTPTITEFSNGLNSGANPSLIAAGPDGNLWFTDGNTGNPAIGRINPATGGIDEFTIGVSGQPAFIGAGPDGNLWFMDFSSALWRINPANQHVDSFSTGLNTGSEPWWITAGPDVNVWFADRGTTRAVGRIDPATGHIDEFSAGLPADSTPTGIVAGPDGNLWLADRGTTKAIARINPATGHIDEFTDGLSTANNPQGITAGSDGNLWFTDFSGPSIGRTTTTGQTTVFSAGLNAGSEPTWIATGSDGAVWFTDEGTTSAIGRITPAGQITEFSTGLNLGASPDGIALGADGNLWFTDGGTTAAIGRITTPPAAVTGAAQVLGSGAATVSGTVNPHAQLTTSQFQFGPTPGYGSATAQVGAGAGFSDAAASQTLGGLSPNTTYHYRLSATNPTDTAGGVDATFTTLPLPAVGPVRVAPKVWRRGSKPALITTRRPPVGTKVSFSLTRAAPVQLAFFSSRPGRRVKKKCVAPTRRNRKAKKCTRLVGVGTLPLAGHAGRNTVRFQGRISSTKRLRPGRYVVKVTASDPTTPAKAPARSASFTIAKG